MSRLRVGRPRSKLYRAQTGDQLGELDTTMMTLLDGALRVALDL